MDIAKILEYSKLATEAASGYELKRELYHLLRAEEGRHFIGIVGSRGVGKTVLLKQLSLDTPDSIYISFEGFNDNLFELARELHTNYGVRSLYLDEVHNYNDFASDLFKIYETLKLKIVFTSSLALAMNAYMADLSRRVVLHTLHPFSLRQYLLFKHGMTFPSLSLDDYFDHRIPREFVYGHKYFHEYLNWGIMPYALDEPQPEVIAANILEKIISFDIPSIAPNLSVGELSAIRKLVTFVGRAPIDGINYSSLSRNLGITYYKAEQYVDLLEKAFVLMKVMPVGANVLKEPKIIMCPPTRLLYAEYDAAIGGLREDYFAWQANAYGIPINYLKSTKGAKTPDYYLPEYDTVVEIGGRGKGRSKFKGIDVQRKIILSDALVNEESKKSLAIFGMIAP